MRSVNLRILSLVLAFVFCIGTTAFPTTVNAVGGEHIVRVGVYADTTTDSRFFSATAESENGFEVGYSNGTHFIPMFSIGYKKIIILPQTNADFNSETLNCVQGDGNLGAYSVAVAKYDVYSRAAFKAKSVGGFVAVVNGGYEVRKSPSPVGGKGYTSPAEGGLMVLDTSGNIILTLEDGNRTFAIRDKKGGAVTVPTLHRSGAVDAYGFKGFFEYSVQDGRLLMVNCIGIEDYTKCVMSNEIGTNVSVETRKAFSVLARTVPLGRKHESLGFDVCTHSACCQVYKGLHQISEENSAIVDSTKGLYCAYKGSPISVLYHNSNGGASCSSVAAWGGDEVPYLTTVFLDEAGESDTWELSFTKEEFYEYISSRRAFSAIQGDAVNMQILETDPYGSDYITVLSVSDNNGNAVEIRTSEDVRSACGFESANFTLEYTLTATVLNAEGKIETVDVPGVMTEDGYKEFKGFGDQYRTVNGETISPDKVVIKGAGAGHGVGFSAIGSEKLAKDGYSYKYILEFFFNGTKLLNLD